MERSAALVLKNGRGKDKLPSALKRYVERVERTSEFRNFKAARALIHGKNIYLFSEQDILITAWPVPEKHFKKRKPREYETLNEEVL